MILYIDTSKSEAHVALLEKGNILAEKEWLSDKNQSEELLSEIDILLKKCKKNKKDLTKIMAVIGPGSYTGLRVGLSTANSLALSFNIEIVGIKAGDNLFKIVKNFTPNDSKFTTSVMPIYSYPPKITIQKTRR